MIKPSVYIAPALAALLTTASAQQPRNPPTFRFERTVTTDGGGPRRLAIDVPLLTGGKPFQTAGDPSNLRLTGGLADLRLLDTAGREVGYLLVPNPPDQPTWKSASILAIAPVDTPTEKSSGFEADFGEMITIDRFRVDGLPPPFLKRIQLEGSGDRAHWTLLVAEGTVFDLPDERLRQTDLSFTPESFRYLRMTWDDSSSGRLPRPAVAEARVVRTAAAPPRLTSPLAFERRPSEPGRSRFRIRLPGGRLPIVALDFDIGGGNLLRSATVFEARLSGSEAVPTTLGSATLRRVVQGELTASSLRLGMSPPVEPQIDLVVEDGNNPPVDLRGVTAVFAELPWIYFESDGGELVARYGNSSLTAPRYDIEAVRPSLKVDSTREAKWGEVRARVEADDPRGTAPALPTVGAALDSSSFRYIRAIPPGDAELVAVSLDAAALAHSTGVARTFADLRVIDAAGRQVPYLVERASEPLSLDLSFERLSTAPKAMQPSSAARSVYRVTWPFDRLPSPRLVLTTSARVFTRRVEVGVERGPDRSRREPWIESVAAETWQHVDQETPAPALVLPLQLPLQLRQAAVSSGQALRQDSGRSGQAGVKELLVIISEGDNTPLPLVSARVLLPAYRLRLFRERGAALRLAYGRDDLSSPQYDLALLAPQLLGVAAAEVTLDPEHAQTPASGAEELLSPRAFWAVLIVAVIVLLALVVRLVKKTDAQSLGSS
jgi:uncharacterized protein DUF3999